MDYLTWEEEEAQIYKQGTPVVLRKQEEQIYFIQEYDLMLVPPIWLKDYPKPCYPEELKVLSNVCTKSLIPKALALGFGTNHLPNLA